MPRIEPVRVSEAPVPSRKLLEGVQRSMGMVPNLLKTMARSPAALAAYLELSHALEGALNAPLREQIALTVAGANRCSYCASAHTALGARAGLAAEEMAANLRGDSGNAETLEALRFAQSVVDKRGWVTDEDLSDVRAAGYSDAQIAEIVAVVTLNLYTNYLNHVAGTDIDFPVVSTPQATVGSGS